MGGEPDATTDEAMGLPNDKADVTMLPAADPNTCAAPVVLGPLKLDVDEEIVTEVVDNGVEAPNGEVNGPEGTTVVAVADPNTEGATIDLENPKPGVDTGKVEGTLAGDADTVTGEPNDAPGNPVLTVEGPKLEGAGVILGELRPDGDIEKVVAVLSAVAEAADEDTAACLDLLTACSKASLNCIAISGVLKRMQNFSGCASPSAKSWASHIQAVSFFGIGASVIPD